MHFLRKKLYEQKCSILYKIKVGRSVDSSQGWPIKALGLISKWGPY